MKQSRYLAAAALLSSLAAPSLAHAQTCGSDSFEQACTNSLVSGTGGAGVAAVYGSDITNGAIGVQGLSQTGIGVYGETERGTTNEVGPFGVYGSSAFGDAVHGSFVGTGSSSGVSGVCGIVGSVTCSGDGTYGTTNATGGTHSGVKGYNSGSGSGVCGYAGGVTVCGSGEFGVYGESNGGDGVHGVYGGTSNFAGVVGISSNSSGGNGGYFETANSSQYGVKGVNTSTGYGGYFTTTGTYSLFANKDIWVNGASLGPSDRRFKKNITPIKGAMEQLLKLQGVNFEWIDPQDHQDMKGVQIGFIAQDVEKIFPEWVRTDKDGYKGLTVAQIEGLEVEAIRSLKTDRDADRAEISELKETVRKLGQGVAAAGPMPPFGFNSAGWGVAGMLGMFIFMSWKKQEKKPG